MREQRYQVWQRRLLESLDALFCERYGRDGNTIEVAHPVALLEAVLDAQRDRHDIAC